MTKEAAMPYTPPSFNAAKLPDDDQHRLWQVYRFGGTWEGKHYQAGDPKIKGRLMGQFTNMIHKEVNKHVHTGAPRGSLEMEARENLSRGIDNYNPTVSEKPARLSTYLHTYVRHSMGRVVSREANAKAMTDSRRVMIGKARPIMEQYERTMGHPIPTAELAKRLGQPVDEVQKMLYEAAPEYSTTMTIDDDSSLIQKALTNRRAVMVVYADEDELGKKIIEAFFPTIVGKTGVAIPQAHTRGLQLRLSQETGATPTKISRRKKEIFQAIAEEMR